MSKIFVGSSIDPDKKNTLDALKSGAIDEKKSMFLSISSFKICFSSRWSEQRELCTNRQYRREFPLCFE